MDRRTFIKAGGAFAVGAPLAYLTACGSSGTGKPAGGSLESRAKAEGGDIIFYCTDAPSAQVWGKAFHKKYPWANLKYLALSGSDISSRVLRAAAAKAPTADVIIAYRAQIGTYVEKKAITKYTIPNIKNVPKDWRDPTNYSVALDQNVQVLAYNNNKIKSVPQDIYELAQPQWKNRIAFDTPQNLGSAALFLAGHRGVWGDEKWKRWLKGLAANNVQVTADATSAYQAVVSGARDLAPDGIDDVFTQKPGTPVAAGFYVGMPSFMAFLCKTAGAQHPNSAQLFINWLLSEQAQRLASTPAAGAHTPVMNIDVKTSVSNIVHPPYSIFGLSTQEQMYNHPDEYLALFNQYWPTS